MIPLTPGVGDYGRSKPRASGDDPTISEINTYRVT